MSKHFLSIPSIQQHLCRFYGKHNKKYLYRGAGNAQNYQNILYYPRDHNEVQPEAVNPPKAFRVQRIKPLSGVPFWEKRILKDLGLIYNAGSDVTIVKNIPEINSRLWKIKHLISVEPITYRYGEPTQNDVNHTFIKENGECIVTKEIAVAPERLKASDDFVNDSERLDMATLKRDALLKWNRHN